MKIFAVVVLALLPLLAAAASLTTREPQSQSGACSNRCYNNYTLKAKNSVAKKEKYFTFANANVKKGEVCDKLNDACLAKADEVRILYSGCKYTNKFKAVKAYCTMVMDHGQTRDIIDTLVSQFDVTIAKRSDGKCNEYQKGFCIREGEGEKTIG